MRLSVEENASPYGFSLMITGSYALLTSRAEARPLDIVAGVAGAASAFFLAELLALTVLRKEKPVSSQKTRLIGRLLSFVSIGCGMGAAWLCALAIPGPLGWLAAGAAGALAYLLLDGLELMAAEKREAED